MFEKYLNEFLTNALLVGLLFGGFGFLFGFVAFGENPIFWLIFGGTYLLIVSYMSGTGLAEKIKVEYEKKIAKVIPEAESKVNQTNSSLKIAEGKENLWRQLLKERTSGFPSLLKYIEYFEELMDKHLSNTLITKSHPAISSAQVVKEEAKRRRVAEFMQRKTQAIIEYYENIAPFLLDFKEQEIDETEDALRDYSDEEKEDPVTNYMTKEEYRKLTSIQRNQMALERYWQRPKPKWLIGRIYERYVGYVFESKGYDVDYVGIFKGYEDLGRDLICKKGNEIVIIQCKYWSQFKTIFEKHIFQFFGTVFQYKDQFRENKVRGIFYTTTELSELARRFALELGIDLEEKFKMDQLYPCIKCNISDNGGTKIYHLPFDQQYDNVKIEPNRGEMYCATAEEAEKMGFRRAYRWKGNKDS